METTMPVARPGQRQFSYDGKGKDLFFIYLKNIVLTFLTLGIYSFWARVRIQKYNYQHTGVFDGRFDYHATGKEKFFGFLKGLLFLLPLIAVLALITGVLTPIITAPIAVNIGFILFAVIMALLRPVFIVGSSRFNLARTSWSNLRFSFDGKIGELYGIFVKGILLMLVTFGIYSSWHFCNIQRFKAGHSKLGDHRLSYHGTGGDIFVRILLGLPLVYLTLGIMFPWFIALMHRYQYNNTSFNGVPLSSNLTGWKVFKVGFLAILLTIFTFGLGIPFAIAMIQRTFAESTSFTADIDIDQLRSSHDAGASALVQGISEAGEAISEVGDFLGG